MKQMIRKQHMLRSRPFRSLLALALVLTSLPLSVLVPPRVLAATVTWTGSQGGACPFGTTLWSTTNGPCWSTSAPPADGDDVVLANTGPIHPGTYDINRTFNSLTLNTPDWGATPGFTVANGGGFVLGLQSGGTITDGNTRGPDTLNTGVALNGPATFILSAGATGLTFGTNAVTGTGPLTLTNNGTADGLHLAVANTYTSSTTVTGTGRVRFDVDGAVPNDSALTVNGSAVFQAASTVGSLAGAGTVAMNGNNTLTVGGDDTSTTFSGVYQDSGGAAALTKTGTGTLTLSGANTHTGATGVDAGTLLVNGSLAAASDVTVASGATLGGTGTVNGDVTASLGGQVAPGAGVGTLTIGGDYTWNGSNDGSATMDFELSNADATADRLAVTGAFTEGTGPTFRFDFQGTGNAIGVPTVYALATFASTTFSARISATRTFPRASAAPSPLSAAPSSSSRCMRRRSWRA